MADQLDMGRLNLNDQGHGQNGFNGERSAYIPPHLRGRPQPAGGPGPAPMDGPPMMNGGGGLGGSAWGPKSVNLPIPLAR